MAVHVTRARHGLCIAPTSRRCKELVAAQRCTHVTHSASLSAGQRLCLLELHCLLRSIQSAPAYLTRSNSVTMQREAEQEALWLGVVPVTRFGPGETEDYAGNELPQPTAGQTHWDTRAKSWIGERQSRILRRELFIRNSGYTLGPRRSESCGFVPFNRAWARLVRSLGAARSRSSVLCVWC
jgi:hypothetical protein